MTDFTPATLSKTVAIDISEMLAPSERQLREQNRIFIRLIREFTKLRKESNKFENCKCIFGEVTEHYNNLHQALEAYIQNLKTEECHDKYEEFIDKLELIKEQYELSRNNFMDLKDGYEMSKED